MNQSELTTEVKRWLRTPLAVNVKKITDTTITAVTLRGVGELWEILKDADPAYCQRRASISSNTHIFAFPSDCMTINKVWDMLTTAKDITGIADNGSGLCRVTSATHGFSTGAPFIVQDVTGTTEANDTWSITVIDDDNFDLVGSTFSNAYVSGGKVFKDESNFRQMFKQPFTNYSGKNTRKWYPRGEKIIVDNLNHTNDLVVNYTKTGDALADIPARFHEGLVSYCVLKFTRIPKEGSENFSDIIGNVNFHRETLKDIKAQVRAFQSVASEPNELPDDQCDLNYLHT